MFLFPPKKNNPKQMSNKLKCIIENCVLCFQRIKKNPFCFIYTLDYFDIIHTKLHLLPSLFYNITRIFHYIVLADRGFLSSPQKILLLMIQARVYRHVIYENVPTAAAATSCQLTQHHKRI